MKITNILYLVSTISSFPQNSGACDVLDNTSEERATDVCRCKALRNPLTTISSIFSSPIGSRYKLPSTPSQRSKQTKSTFEDELFNKEFSAKLFQEHSKHMNEEITPNGLTSAQNTRIRKWREDSSIYVSSSDKTLCDIEDDKPTEYDQDSTADESISNELTIWTNEGINKWIKDNS